MPVLPRWFLIPALVASGAAAVASARDEVPADLRAFFSPPAAIKAPASDLRSPLIFDDGRPVASPADWAARREEIRRYWHERMGSWPALVARPRIEISETQDRGGVTQHRVEIEVAPGVMQDGFLLLPPAGFRGPGPPCWCRSTRPK